MKLIIDIKEKQYEFIKQGMSIRKVIEYPALMEAICENIVNGIPLDKIRDKIAKLNTDMNIDLYNKAINETLQIIDKI